MKDVDNKSENLVTHENGMAVIASFEYTMLEQTDNGFVFMINPEGSRQKNYIDLRVSSSHEIKEPQIEAIDGIDYHFSESKAVGGSGGNIYTLIIWKPIGKTGILLKRYIQTDYRPDFSDSWKLIKSANLHQEPD